MNIKKIFIQIFIILLSLSPFIIFELYLTFSDFKSSDKNYFRGFDTPITLFTKKNDYFVTSSDEINRFNPQKFPIFPVEKNECNIFCVGDSITWGDQGPGKPSLPTSYSAILQEMLNKNSQAPKNRTSKKFHVINCGAKTFSSTRVKKVVQHLINNKKNYRPKLIIANFGTSEFLEFDAKKALLSKIKRSEKLYEKLKIIQYIRNKLGELIKKSKGLTLDKINSRNEFLQSSFVHPSQFITNLKERTLVLNHARENIKEIINLCKNAHIPLIINTVPSNLKWPPAAYDATIPQIKETIKKAGILIKKNMTDKALDMLHPLIEQYPENAGLSFRAAQAFEKQNNLIKALQFYRLAKNNDAFPLRALGSFNNIIRQEAKSAGITVIDFEKEFKKLFKNNISDYSIFIDNCHPNSKGHTFMAKKIYEHLPKSVQSDNFFQE